MVRSEKIVIVISLLCWFTLTSESAEVNVNSDIVTTQNDSVNTDLEIDMDEVVVTGVMPLVENKADRKIIHVSGSYLGNTTDGDEMLRLTPGLLKTQNGLTVPGAVSPVYYINGKRVRNQEDITALDPKNVKKIEIINNPPAMYEADGDAVVLIITKPLNESALRVGATYKQSKYAGANAYVDGTLRSGIFTMNGRYAYNYNRSWSDETNLSSVDKNDSLYTTKHYEGVDQRHNGRLVFDWMFKEKHNLNIDVNGYYSTSKGDAKRDALFTNKNDSDFTTYFKLPSIDYEIDATINYKYNIDTVGQILNAQAECYYNRNSFNRDYYLTPLDKQVENPIWTFDNNVATPILLSGQIDYVKPIGEKWRIEAGLKFYSLSTHTTTDISGGDSLKQSYSTTENTLAEYFNFHVTPIKNLSLSAGLRCETQWRKSAQNEVNYLDTISTDLFPSVSILYKFSDRYNIGLSYSRRIERPTFYMLDPSLRKDPLLDKHGNPDLKNTFNNKISISSTLFADLNISAYARYRENPIAFYIYNKTDDPKVTGIRYYHTNNYWQFGADISYNRTFFNIWDFSFYASVYSNNFEYEEDGVKKNNNIPGAYAELNNQIALPWSLKLTVNFYINYPGSIDAVISSPLYYSYISLGRSFLNGSLDVNISLNNIFYNATYTQTSVLSGHNINKTRIDDRYGKISIVYKIGKAYEYHSKSKSQEEKNRM